MLPLAFSVHPSILSHSSSYFLVKLALQTLSPQCRPRREWLLEGFYCQDNLSTGKAGGVWGEIFRQVSEQMSEG